VGPRGIGLRFRLVVFVSELGPISEPRRWLVLIEVVVKELKQRGASVGEHYRQASPALGAEDGAAPLGVPMVSGAEEGDRVELDLEGEGVVRLSHRARPLVFRFAAILGE
jgi:hypothetical protein